MLFDQICNSQWFIDTAMIMFMNKTDIFRQKIKYSSIREYFPDYNGKAADGGPPSLLASRLDAFFFFIPVSWRGSFVISLW